MAFKKGHKTNIGHKPSEETKQKISKSLMGHKMPAHVKKRLLEANLGHVMPEHVKQNMSRIHTGKKISEETRERMCKAQQNRDYTPSTETLNKIRAARAKQVFPIRDSKPEVAMQNQLKELGVPFTTHKLITGQPDIFIEPNICLFIDGCFWHGCKKHFPNPTFRTWNPERDGDVNKTLKAEGYAVLRIWEHDIETK